VRLGFVVVASMLLTASSSLGQTTGSVTPADSVAWARVTYISGASVYLDAGSRAGLREGSIADVVRGGATVAQLVVTFISSSRASCTVRSGTMPAIGDSVRFVPIVQVAARSDSTPVARANATPTRGTGKRSPPIRGRLGVRYFQMELTGDAPSRLSQPAFDARLDGPNLGGSPIGVTVDVRAYRGSRTRPGGAQPTEHTSVTRVYQTALYWHRADSPARVTLGRQFATALASVGLFDGIAIDIDRVHWSAGGFSGTQPEPATFGFSSDVRESGAYLQWHNAVGRGPSWSLTTGAVGSYARGEIDREFVYLQGMVNSRRFSLYAAEELDINRGWRSEAEGSTTTPTSTYAMARWSLSDAFSIQGGFDSRRSVRLYRDFINPEIEFDDSFREGTWGGFMLSAFGSRVRASGDARVSRGGAAGKATSFTGSFGVSRLTPLGLGAQLRTTVYDGLLAAGTLRSASLEVNPYGVLRLQASAGMRDDQSPLAVDADRRTKWFGGDADLGIGRSLYLMLSTYQETQAQQKSIHSQVSLSWRF
jgi:hypothetical protein